MTETTITHSKVSGISDGGDTSLVRPSDWNDGHVIDWAEVGDLAAVFPASAVGSVSEVPRADHVHQDSAAGRIFAFNTFR